MREASWLRQTIGLPVRLQPADGAQCPARHFAQGSPACEVSGALERCEEALAPQRCATPDVAANERHRPSDAPEARGPWAGRLPIDAAALPLVIDGPMQSRTSTAPDFA